MKFDLSNLDSIKLVGDIVTNDDEIFVLSHAPYDIFETFIVANIAQYIPSAPKLIFNSFADVNIKLNDFSTSEGSFNIFYIFNWADLYPFFELNSRSGENSIIISDSEFFERVQSFFSLVENIAKKTNVNCLTMLPSLQESYVALGHIFEDADISKLYFQLTNYVNDLKLNVVYKTDACDFSNYLKYHIYDSLDGIKSISKMIASHFYQPDFQIKCLFVDFDDTIWPSNIGDWTANPEISEKTNKNYHCLQQVLKSLSKNGIYLIGVSKNDPDYVLEKFDTINMPLRKRDFYSISCSWDAKSKVIENYLLELNILQEHCLFLDDNPAELLEVSATHQNLKSVHVTRNINDLNHVLSYLRSNLRTSSSKREIAARKISRPQPKFGNDKSYLRGLELKLDISWMNDLNGRPLELINKTNQFNLNGIRILGPDLKHGYSAIKAELSDKYGDFGVIGILVFKEDERSLEVVNFVLSCRAFSRGIELSMLIEILSYSNGKTVKFNYRKTERNSVIGKTLDMITDKKSDELILSDERLIEAFEEYKGVLDVTAHKPKVV